MGACCSFKSLFKVVLGAFFGRDIYVPLKMNWLEARKICRRYYADLSSINSQEKQGEFFKIAGSERLPDAWIGLYKDAKDTWKWSEGKTASFLNWSRLQKSSDDNRWNCEMDKFPFYCFNSNLQKYGHIGHKMYTCLQSTSTQGQ
uniref:C-type lectin domain-containing protein n=1 Tax=Seriola lalandi dorsalis TaxID=1841481 RepID=A0A3B4XA65_SERLL